MDYLTYRGTTHGIYKLFYTSYISVYHAHHEIFRAQVGKGGINQGVEYDCHNDECIARYRI